MGITLRGEIIFVWIFIFRIQQRISQITRTKHKITEMRLSAYIFTVMTIAINMFTAYAEDRHVHMHKFKLDQMLQEEKQRLKKHEEGEEVLSEAELNTLNNNIQFYERKLIHLNNLLGF